LSSFEGSHLIYHLLANCWGSTDNSASR